MEKPSCIGQLKELANSLTDRDVNLKACMSKVKKIINDDKLSDEEKVEKIKGICSTHGS